jgi:hypothetical protein
MLNVEIWSWAVPVSDFIIHYLWLSERKSKYFRLVTMLLFYVFLEKLPWPPLWSSGQSSWLQIQRSGFDSRCCQIFWEVLGLERGTLSLVNTTEKILGRSGSGLESREYGRRDSSLWPRGIFYPQKLALTSPTSGGRSVGIVRWQTQATEFRRYISYSSPKL